VVGRSDGEVDKGFSRSDGNESGAAGQKGEKRAMFISGERLLIFCGAKPAIKKARLRSMQRAEAFGGRIYRMLPQKSEKLPPLSIAFPSRLKH
jgi:hypothetical protein